MRRIKTYKKWSIWRLTAAEAIDVGGRFAAFLPETDPGAMDEPEWAADSVQELIDFIDSYETRTRTDGTGRRATAAAGTACSAARGCRCAGGPQRPRQASQSAHSGRDGNRRKETKMVNRRKVFVQQFSDLLRSGRRTGVERLELSDNGNLVTICFEGGGRREVNVEGDSEAALILDVIRRVLY